MSDDAGTEREYRVQERSPDSHHVPSRDWHTVVTGRGGGRPYRSLRAAKGVLTREKADETRRQSHHRGTFAPKEFRVQSRPVSTAWEDVVIDS